MKINELTNGTSDVTLEGTVIEKGDIRTVNTRFGTRDICTFKVEDDSGTINFSLWEDKIETIKNGDKIEISGAYVTEWNGTLQLNIPKDGSIKRT
jgi:replication factor A1